MKIPFLYRIRINALFISGLKFSIARTRSLGPTHIRTHTHNSLCFNKQKSNLRTVLRLRPTVCATGKKRIMIKNDDDARRTIRTRAVFSVIPEPV